MSPRTIILLALIALLAGALAVAIVTGLASDVLA
ncbi:MAG: hypothetical protein QOI80_869 [Solirubrobacteraceae bacterium]|jgi:hypothetical protein|nr:hypothetical protein [Solirubrobacteraceae bacterium]